MNKLISIIIPFYNPGDALLDCLSRILSQACKDIEIILINDGSSEELSQINELIKDFWEVDISLIEYPNNHGVSYARNLGLEKAASDYVWFIDADDLIADDAIKTVVDAISTRCDVYQFGAEVLIEDNERGSILHATAGEGMYHAPILPLSLGCPLYMWNHVIKRSLANTVRFNESLRICEDRDYLFRVYRNAKTLSIAYKHVYKYIKHRISATSSVSFEEMIAAGIMDREEYRWESSISSGAEARQALSVRTGQIVRALLTRSPSCEEIKTYREFYKSVEKQIGVDLKYPGDVIAFITARAPNWLIQLAGKVAPVI